MNTLSTLNEHHSTLINTIQQLPTLCAFCALYSECEYDPNYFSNSIDAGMNESIFDLIIYHHGSLTGHRMAYVGGDIFIVPNLDADRFNFWHLKSVLETY
jgi:hypothetical protein